MRNKLLLITDEISALSDMVQGMMATLDTTITITYEERHYSSYEQLRGFDCIIYTKSLKSLTDWLSKTEVQIPYFPTPIMWVNSTYNHDSTQAPPPRYHTTLLCNIALPCPAHTFRSVLDCVMNTWKNPHEPKRLRHGKVSLHFHSHGLSYNGQNVYLTPGEFNLLTYLFLLYDQAVSIDEIAMAIWGNKAMSFSSIRVLIYRLRKKLKEEVGLTLIQTQYGKGYSLAEA
ncbi:winged helix-turn-helix domain-containing protein [Vibrio ouci]|nr:winged helix-turn-helix domain-containing protein [Vibrio ouci]